MPDTIDGVNTPRQVVYRNYRDDYSVEVRLAILEQQYDTLVQHITDIKSNTNKMQGDLNQLVQMTTVGKAAWKGLVWLGTILAGVVTTLYFITQLKGSWSIMHLPMSSTVLSPIPSVIIPLPPTP